MNGRGRDGGAKWLRDLSLATRLSWLVALIVCAVVSSVAYLEVRSFEGHIDRDLTDAARLAARSAADTLAQRAIPLDPLDIRDTLHDLVEADPVLDEISVVEVTETGDLRVFTSTSTEERVEVLDLAGRAVATKGPVTDRSSTVVTFALPVPRRGNYAVAATVGLESLIQARAHEWRVALGFVVPTIVLVTILVHLTVRHLVGRPLGAILRTMAETSGGDLRARTPITRRDELGTIAARLNGMLDEIERFNQSLHDRIERATRALSLRNAQLAASQHQLLALRESLGQAERVAALGQFAANVAHQAGTPLNLVSGYVQMIRDDPRTNDWIRARLQTVDAQIQQVTRVLRTMLDHARAPSGVEVVSLADVIERVREIAQPRLSRANIRLEVSVADALPPVTADATQLEMVVLNLVTNALDAMADGGAVSITAAARPGGVRLEVADTGPGIPLEIMARVFDPWVTTKPSRPGHRPGPRHRARCGAGTRRARCRPSIGRPQGPSSSSSCRPRPVTSSQVPSGISQGLVMARILLVDDDAETCRFIEELLDAPDRQFVSIQDPAVALARIRSEAFDLLISDIDLNAPQSGLDLLRRFKAEQRGPVVLISGFGSLETAIEAVRAGAYDYISKPFVIADVKRIVDHALEQGTRQGEATEMPASPPGSLIGRTPRMLEVYKQIAHAADSLAPVLIIGESGVGKELVARAIHGHSARAREPFVAINCGAIADTLVESELFGHQRGSFTGAVADHKGVFEQAGGGTVLLDEIGDTTTALQVRLLRVLEEGEVRPVGGTRALRVPARVLAATNAPLEQAVTEGRFRQDLYYRLSVIRILVPPLRDRRADIPLLIGTFLDDACRRARQKKVTVGRSTRRPPAPRLAWQRSRAREHHRASGRVQSRFAHRGIRLARYDDRRASCATGTAVLRSANARRPGAAVPPARARCCRGKPDARR